MKRIISLLLLTVLVACSDPKKEEVELITDEVINLHDQMMPLMDDLYKSRIQLQKITETDTLAAEKISLTIAQIQKAEDAMMNWMRNFNPTYQGSNHEETIQYLNQQKQTMELVADEMNEAIQNGSEILGSN